MFASRRSVIRYAAWAVPAVSAAVGQLHHDGERTRPHVRGPDLQDGSRPSKRIVGGSGETDAAATVLRTGRPL